jgi:serine protease
LRRGGTSYNEKAYLCQLGDGVAAIIYNDMDGEFEGSLDAGTNVTIPTFAVSRDVGLSLLDRLDDDLTVVEEKGYGYLSGTSMAAPHVTGAVALIWRLCPGCPNQDVQDCIFETALDLGDAGKDDVYGHGLLQTSDARECLVQKDCCT